MLMEDSHLLAESQLNTESIDHSVNFLQLTLMQPLNHEFVLSLPKSICITNIFNLCNLSDALLIFHLL